MFFRKTVNELLSKYKKIRLYVDMDGVIADYVVGEAKDYDKKRALKTTIKQLEELSNLNEITNKIVLES